ncbi:MAG: hypothetical protein K9I85_14850 [Saprospiraceae bacterium]|nr:hypothetical protein [Saprospiraceae bacterium]
MKIVILFCFFLALGYGCKKDSYCNCKDEWQSAIKYEVDSKVWYHDTCWINPNTTGRGILPGPWLENGNDIWIMCVEP